MMGVLNPLGAKVGPLGSEAYFPACSCAAPTKDDNDGCGARFMKVVLVDSVGAPGTQCGGGMTVAVVSARFEIGTMVGTLAISSGPSSTGP